MQLDAFRNGHKKTSELCNDVKCLLFTYLCTCICFYNLLIWEYVRVMYDNIVVSRGGWGPRSSEGTHDAPQTDHACHNEIYLWPNQKYKLRDDLSNQKTEELPVIASNSK